MSLKDVANQGYQPTHGEDNPNSPKGGSGKSKTVPEQELDMVKSSVMMDSMVEGSMYYLFGCLFTYYKLNGWEPIDPEQAVTELKELKDIDGLDTDEDVEKFLKDSDERLHQFLRWYMYDSR